ncbi:hypothetical protein ASJ81_18825 [Methanosarcina spelaei]|uniref:Uncharacterized protein n=1 Tax=Methanosarcina spelaei TaxID=1036679 RepID=A0A2A2HUU7_9EURY|nr:hypothetical protein [Methanosarcina spelaei]PAV13078.1 hypothetical protein ASJ81_18825 [Methanosarcina spelaei]
MTIINEIYPNLSWALTNNYRLNNILSEQYIDNPHCLSYLDNLISELLSYNCKGIQDKLKDASDLNKFISTLSELQITLILAKNEEIGELKLLHDNYFLKESPDILFRNRNFTFYVEVRRIYANPYIVDTILDHLQEFLKGYPFCVNIFLGTELSIPKMRGTERIAQKDLVKESLRIFEEEFKEKIASDMLTSSFVIETNYIKFTVEKTKSGKGYPGFITSDLIEVPTDILCTYITERLVEKAAKRDSFNSEHRKIYYIVAFDCHEPSIDAIDMNELLYGHMSYISELNITGSSEEDYAKNRLDYWNFLNNNIKNSASWRIIEQAKNRGWEKLLTEKCLIPNDYSYIDDEGIFISETKMKNVSGVLFRGTRNEIAFYPNPFCDTEINNPKILNFMK